jgi:hypothetical protein
MENSQKIQLKINELNNNLDNKVFVTIDENYVLTQIKGIEGVEGNITFKFSVGIIIKSFINQKIKKIKIFVANIFKY